jgi:uncharacterized protein YdiU (UPF0061 family)
VPAADGADGSEGADEIELLAPGRLGDAFYTPDTVGDAERAVLAEWLARYRRRLRADGRVDGDRAEAMNRVNPNYVLRNYLAQEAIDAAEAGDDSEVWALLEVLRHPYDEQPGRDRYAARRPDWARTRPGCSTLSCSS